MRLIEIRAQDKIVIVDGAALKFDFVIDKDISAVHWDASVPSGFIEMVKGEGRVLKDFSRFDYILKSFKEQLDQRETTDYSFMIVPHENSVTVDSVTKIIPDMDIDENYRLVRWDGKNGFIETKNGTIVMLTGASEFEDIIFDHALILADEKNKNQAAQDEYNLPINVWKRDIAAMDSKMPRSLEDHIESDHNGKCASEYQQSAYDAKKSLRKQKPAEL